MSPVLRELARSVLHRRPGRGKNIDKGDAPGSGGLGHGGGVKSEIPDHRLLCPFNRHRRQKDDFWSRFSIESRGLELLQVFREALFELIELLFSPETLIESESGEDHIDFFPSEMLRHRGEIVGPRLQVHLVAGPRKIPDDEVEVRMGLIEHRLEDAVTPRLLEEPVADKGDAVALFKLQRQGRHHCLALNRIRRRSRVNAVALQRRIERRGCLARLDILRIDRIHRKRSFCLGGGAERSKGEECGEPPELKYHVGNLAQDTGRVKGRSFARRSSTRPLAIP